MTTVVYQSWLADRGIDSPGSQPFQPVASDILPESHMLILATANAGDVATIEAVTRLAKALRKTSGHISWLVVDSTGELPSVRILRAVLPTLTNLVRLTETTTPPPEANYAAEELTVASRPLRVLYGPTMTAMTEDPETKKLFWQQLQLWIKPIN